MMNYKLFKALGAGCLLLFMTHSCNLNSKRTHIAASKNQEEKSSVKEEKKMEELKVNEQDEISLLEHLQEQKEFLLENEYNEKVTLEVDTNFLKKIYGEGSVKLKITEIDGEPPIIYGESEDGISMEFLSFGISMEILDEITIDKTYVISWLEAIYNLEPFDHGVQRCFIATKITKN